MAQISVQLLACIAARTFVRTMVAGVCVASMGNSAALAVESVGEPIVKSVGESRVPNVCTNWEMSEVGRLDTALIDEASGLAVSRNSDRLYHVNDSGDGGYFYQTDRSGGNTKRIEVAGFKPYDVEDLGYGLCPGTTSGELCLAIADIGDNRKKRKKVRIVFVREVANFPEKVKPYMEVSLTYPSGPKNAEAFAVLPNGDLVIFSKELRLKGESGPSIAYRAKAKKLKDGAQVELEEFGSIDIAALTKSTGLGSLVTGMSVTSKGDRFLLLTYDRAIEFALELGSERLPESGRLQPGRDYQMIDLKPLPQQEAIAYDKDDRAFFYDTESIKTFLGPFLLAAPLVRAVCRDRAPASVDAGGGSGKVSHLPLYLARFSDGKPSSSAPKEGKQYDAKFEFQSVGDARFVKLALNFPRPLDLQRVSVESCGKSFVDGADFFFSPGERHAFAEGGTPSLEVNVPNVRLPLVRSMSAVLLRNTEPCVRSVRLFLRDGKELAPVFPEVIDASVLGGAKTESLFDSRPGTVSEIGPQGIVIDFGKVRKIDGVVAWVGNQASSDLFRHSHHGKSLKVESDGRVETLALRDAPGAQDLKFSKPIESRRFKLSSDAKAVFSELRFFEEGRILIPRDVTSFVRSSERKEAFRSTGLGRLLDGEHSTHDEKKSWVFRFRSDGTFFVHGYGDDIKEARIFSALGDFEFETAGVNDGVHKIFLKLRGHRMALPMPWDGNWCGVACGSEEPSRQARPVNDHVVIERNERNDLVMIRNRTSRRERALPFEDLVLVPSSRRD